MSRLDAAAEWLKNRLEAGEVPAATVKADAIAARLSWVTVRRAADKLHISKVKSSARGPWVWSLPELAEESSTQNEDLKAGRDGVPEVPDPQPAEMSTLSDDAEYCEWCDDPLDADGWCDGCGDWGRS